MKEYPDMTELFARKEARRRQLANLPVAEKMEIAQRLQEIGRQAPGRHVKLKGRKAKVSSTKVPSRKQKCV